MTRNVSRARPLAAALALATVFLSGCVYLLDLLRSLGGAKVDRDARSVEARLASARPDLPGIAKILGQPTARMTDGADTILRYRYVPVTHQPTSRPAVFDMRLRFNTATGQMLHWEGRTPVGKIGFNFEKKQ